MKIRENARLAIDIYKTSKFILLLPIYNNVAAWKVKICQPPHMLKKIVTVKQSAFSPLGFLR
jgi:hypothetical protein